MLRVAYHCFSVAATLQGLETVCVDFNEERWLCQYMLGKIAEKQCQPPDVFLNYYLSASNFLYDSNATYPIKINHNNPTTLSVEALELFYRTNASILKYLEKCSYITRPIGDLFKHVLKKLSSSPFAFNKAKIVDTCIYAVKWKYHYSSKSSINKNHLNSDAFIKANAGENFNFVEVPRANRNHCDYEETRASENTIATNSSSSFSNFGTESETSNTDEANSYYSESEVEKIYEKAIINLEECVTRFPEHYKSIYRLASFYINGPDGVKNENVSERLLLNQYQTGIGNIINGLFYDRKANNIFNGIWRIPSSEIDRPGNFSSYLVKCVDILIKLLTDQSNYNLLIEIILRLQRSPDIDNKMILRL
ncbi:calcineurin-binding protein cabin-1-like [Drosophila tropicalis]|uniref:calcineurin-binding protein cabin-1-like n=1 Tax=Drosophila tropicalis TaxID=46794 RepID=UPI0035ABD31D